MKNFKWLLVLLAILICGGAAGCGDSVAKNEIRFGTGGVGGKYYAYGSTLAEMLKAEKNISLDVKTTAGSAANLRLLREGFLDLALVQSDLLSDALKGTGNFAAVGPGTGYAAVAGLYTEACQIVVSADSEIKSVQDLVGKKISVGERESGVLKNAEQILLAHGLTFEMIEPDYLSFADSAAALERGEIDAFFCTAGAPTIAISDLSKKMKIRLLSIEPRIFQNMMTMYHGYTPCKIPVGTYEGQTEEISTLGVKAVLVARKNLTDKIVVQVTDCIFENADKISSAANVPSNFNLEHATKNVPSAFHSGAVKYYAAQGVEVEIYNGGDSKSVQAEQD